MGNQEFENKKAGGGKRDFEDPNLPRLLQEDAALARGERRANLLKAVGLTPPKGEYRDESTAPPIGEEAREVIRRVVEREATNEERDLVRTLQSQYKSWDEAVGAVLLDKLARIRREDPSAFQD